MPCGCKQREPVVQNPKPEEPQQIKIEDIKPTEDDQKGEEV